MRPVAPHLQVPPDTGGRRECPYSEKLAECRAVSSRRLLIAAALCAGIAAFLCPLAVAAVRVTVIQTDGSQHLAVEQAHTFGRRRPFVTTLHVNDRIHYQSVIAVGGAMTDTAAWLIWTQLTPANRTRLLHALFAPSGAHLGFVRIPIGGSDFTTDGVPYTYDDGPADPTLARFSIAHDRAYILPALKAALALNPAAFLEAVPWSPPPWMKANDRYDNIDNAGTLLPADYPVDAAYDVRFLEAYAAAGVPVDAISPQDEPGVNTAIPSLQLDEAQESQLITQDLAPALARAGLYPTIFGWDLSWGPLGAQDSLVQLAQQGRIGLAFHCYMGSPLFMTGVHDVAPAAPQIVDECTTGSFDNWDTSEVLIASLRNWASAVGLWNLALDPAGGPVIPPNSACQGCTGLATVANGTFTLSEDYYELAQLSRYLIPGAWRVASDQTVSYQLTPNYHTQVTAGLDDVALEDPDGTLVLFVHSTLPGTSRFNVEWHGRFVTLTIPAGATQTLAWQAYKLVIQPGGGRVPAGGLGRKSDRLGRRAPGSFGSSQR
jgi:glucosylceramidase